MKKKIRRQKVNYPVNGNIFPQICIHPHVKFLFLFRLLPELNFCQYISSKKPQYKISWKSTFYESIIYVCINRRTGGRCDKRMDRQIEIMKVMTFFSVAVQGRLKFSMLYCLSHDHSTVFATLTKLLLIRIPTGRTLCVYLALYRYRPCNRLFSRPIL